MFRFPILVCFCICLEMPAGLAGSFLVFLYCIDTHVSFKINLLIHQNKTLTSFHQWHRLFIFNLISSFHILSFLIFLLIHIVLFHSQHLMNMFRNSPTFKYNITYWSLKADNLNSSKYDPKNATKFYKLDNYGRV